MVPFHTRVGCLAAAALPGVAAARIRAAAAAAKWWARPSAAGGAAAGDGTRAASSSCSRATAARAAAAKAKAAATYLVQQRNTQTKDGTCLLPTLRCSEKKDMQRCCRQLRLLQQQRLSYDGCTWLLLPPPPSRSSSSRGAVSVAETTTGGRGGVQQLSACTGGVLEMMQQQQQRLAYPLQQQQLGRNGAANLLQWRGFSTAAADSSYDVVVIGGGPGGYVAAIKAAQLGLRTACVEKRGSLGGTCLNVGCIPSKAVLNISNKFAEAREHFSRYGITGVTKENVCVDISKVQQQKERIVKTLTQGIEFLFKKNKVDYIIGEGRLADPHTVEVMPSAGGEAAVKCMHAKNIILATGSEPSPLPGNTVPIDERVILSSTGALDLPAVPKRMAVIGGGVIGLELGSVWRNFGAEVTVVEFLDRLLPPVDEEVAKAFHKEMLKLGIKFQLGTKVIGADVRSDSATLHLEPAQGGEHFQLEADVVLVAVGRRPFTKGLGLEDLGIEKDKVGRLIVDSSFGTTRHPHIKAIGDLIPGPMLAHKAEEEGIACVELIAGRSSGHVNYSTIPSVVYTHPEIAGVGKTEEELKKEGVNYAKGKFPFAANSRARCIDIADGFVKILTNKETDKILGAWVIGPEAGELIAQLVLALEYGASAEDLGRTCTAHPTLSEAVKEACMACYDKPIHVA